MTSLKMQPHFCFTKAPKIAKNMVINRRSWRIYPHVLRRRLEEHMLSAVAAALGTHVKENSEQVGTGCHLLKR
jgi:hypothetical protein